MDDAFQLIANQHTLQDEDEDEQLRLLSLAAVFIGISEAEQSRHDRRHPSRLYLRRAELMPEPRIDSPWQRLWASQTDRAFITTMGVDVSTFRLILEGPGHFAERWESTPIPRNDVSSSGEPRPHVRSLDAPGALGLTLHFLGSAMLETSLQQIFALIPSTVSRYLTFSRRILLETLRCMFQARIQMPKTEEEFAGEESLIVARHPLLVGAFGSVDGLSLLAQESDDPEVENATYNGWKSEHCISNVLCFSPRGLITHAVINCPGSWHDAHVARPIFEMLRTRVPDGYYLVADTAFPRGTGSIAGKIRAPVKAGERIPSDPIEQEKALRFNRELLSYRQTAEWGMRIMQGSFGRLHVPLPIEDAAQRRELIETCVRMFNLRSNCVNINQIRSVYMPLWEVSEDEMMWSEVGNMMFGEIRRRDRVSRYHVLPT